MTAPSLRAVLDSQMSERDLLQAIVDLARLLDWSCYHTWNSRHSEPGFPDLVLMRERLVVAELKSMTGKVSAEQQRWLDAFSANGVRVYVWRPVDWSSGEIERVLRG